MVLIYTKDQVLDIVEPMNRLELTLCAMIVLNELSSLRRWFRGDALLQLKKTKNKQTIKPRSFKEESNIICKFFPRCLYSCIIHTVVYMYM